MARRIGDRSTTRYWISVVAKSGFGAALRRAVDGGAEESSNPVGRSPCGPGADGKNP
jgi:hypothetical protein